MHKMEELASLFCYWGKFKRYIKKNTTRAERIRKYIQNVRLYFIISLLSLIFIFCDVKVLLVDTGLDIEALEGTVFMNRMTVTFLTFYI